MFPVIPPCGTERKKSLETNMKSLQGTNLKLRYQIRLGEHDFCIFLKEYIKGEYTPYREVPIEFVDPHEEAPPIKTANTNVLPEELPESEDDLRKHDNGSNINWKILTEKQKRELFRLKLKEKQSKVSILQISEFLGEYLNGTRTAHHEAFLARCPETLILGDLSGSMDI